MKKTARGTSHRHLLLLLGLLLCFANAQATTVVSLDVDTLASEAELIFEGEVIAHKVQRDLGSGLIYTYVSFSVLDVLKGDLSGTVLELRFTGGSYGGRIVEISGLTIPELGEQGIYFVESLSRPLLNPLLGWSQGQFLIIGKGRERRVYSAANEPILDIRPVAGVPTSLRRPRAYLQGSGDSATGVVTEKNPVGTTTPLSVEEFKSRVLDLLN